VAGESSVGACGEAAVYLVVEVFAFGGFHGDVAGERVQEGDVFVRGVAQGPYVAPRPDDREVSGGLEFGGGGVGLVFGPK
jgi:hypothetical protein